MRPLLFLLSLLLAATHSAQERAVRAGLLRDQQPVEVMIAATRQPLQVIVDGGEPFSLTSRDALKVTANGSGLLVKNLAGEHRAKRSVVIRGTGPGTIRMRTLAQPRVERDYPGTLEIRREGDHLLVVNEVPLEDYVGGVVLSEAGKDKDIEYYKLQAVSCRTYALVNQRRHLPEGFEVCDGTHCQVYKGQNTLDTIRMAVNGTKGMVVVDANIRLIHATFHSNCGGETMNAEDLWSKSEPYLVSTTDSFCVNAPHAAWHKSMPRTKWLGYLRRTYMVDTANAEIAAAACSFEPSCRFIYLPGVQPHVPFEQVRADMRFNSALFGISTAGDQVVFEGRGFGHGVGLCQEGAMRMARRGYSFTDILHHYFAEVHLVDLHTMDFFRDEGY